MLVAALLTGAGVAAATQEPSAVTGPTAAEVAPTRLPDLPRLPAEYDAPATLTGAAYSGASDAALTVAPIAEGEDQVPARALEAYQRAASVIEQVDPSCHLSWPLLAAIGRVESDHGRTGGSQLAQDGAARPPILGPPLDGRPGTARLVDTDHGTMDGDAGLDRAVGPMQFIPSTWSAVAVDADADGWRDPQDIDDAALAAAVYLCAWHDDLATEPGQHAAVLRYNHSPSYVRLVLATMTGYADASDISASALLPAGMTPVTPSPEPETAIAVAGPADEDPPEVTWSDVEDPVWFAAPPPPTPSAASPAPSQAVLPTPTASASPSAPPSDLPTPEVTSSSTPSPDNAPGATSSPSENQNPTTSSAAPSAAPSDGPADLTTDEQTVVTACTTASADMTGEGLLACLAGGLQLREDDPRLLWILAQVTALPSEPSPVSSMP